MLNGNGETTHHEPSSANDHLETIDFREAVGKRYELRLAATADLGRADQFTTAQQISVEPRQIED